MGEKLKNCVRPLSALICAYGAAAFLTVCVLYTRCFDPAAPKQRIHFAKLLYGGDLGAWLVFGCFFALALLLFARYFREKRRFRLSSLLLALCFALIWLVGLCRTVSGAVFFLPTRLPTEPLQLAVFTVFFYAAVELLNARLDASRVPAPAAAEREGRRFFLIAALLLLAWLPHFAANFPGSLCVDARGQLAQALGLSAWNSDNPVLDTLVFGLLFKAGRALSGRDSGGVALIVAVQYLLMALSFSYVCLTARRLTGSARLETAGALFFALLPMFGGAGQVVLKDTLHLPFVLMLLCTWLDFCAEPGSRGRALRFGALLLFSALTRKAAIGYSLAAGAALVILFWRRRYPLRALLASVLSAAALYFALELAVIPACGIGPELKGEFYALPFRQIAYTARAQDAGIGEDEKAVIDAVLDYEAVKESYDPDSADSIKWLLHGSGEDMRAFRRLYGSWLRRYPADMLRAAVSGFWKYVYPFSPGYMPYRAYMADCTELGLRLEYFFPALHRSMLDYAAAWADSPLLTLFVGPGLYACLLLFAFFRVLRARLGDLLLFLLPLMVLLAGLVFTPVNGETRYAYPIIAAAPLLLALLRLPPCGR